ncbi:MAG TPA: hypothetical protein DEF45_11820 [Rhodopirellula sp.]|nr:hypothetical protein [Rhodopirellula sp.]
MILGADCVRLSVGGECRKWLHCANLLSGPDQSLLLARPLHRSGSNGATTGKSGNQCRDDICTERECKQRVGLAQKTEPVC